MTLSKEKIKELTEEFIKRNCAGKSNKFLALGIEWFAEYLQKQLDEEKECNHKQGMFGQCVNCYMKPQEEKMWHAPHLYLCIPSEEKCYSWQPLSKPPEKIQQLRYYDVVDTSGKKVANCPDQDELFEKINEIISVLNSLIGK